MRIFTPNEVIQFFSLQNKDVFSFAGFGELGYEKKERVEKIILDILESIDPFQSIVNSGTLLRKEGEEGIAMVYRLAKSKGFMTTGIHPSIALDFSETHPISPFCDFSFYVEDDTWGGYLNDRFDPSPTLNVLLQVTHDMIVIGGGKHAADELSAFIKNQKKVRYFPAEMNQGATSEWCERARINPLDLKGAAHTVWLNRGN